eukprot:TRINITY_DN1775_c1_g1_i2.p1 TRINITY_DN1775_c1_g1~~TRINITY_DN1775_c1_g1_i2.p1  ORF type:complete len:187 (+),score=25.70 TRINITY_DN1775_c1_g1_i2:550-1110(+)
MGLRACLVAKPLQINLIGPMFRSLPLFAEAADDCGQTLLQVFDWPEYASTTRARSEAISPPYVAKLPTDMLFLDTRRTLNQRLLELNSLHTYVSQFIVIPESDYYDYVDEDDTQPKKLAKHSDYLDKKHKKVLPKLDPEAAAGLQTAVARFLTTHRSEWRLLTSVQISGGITVLARIAPQGSHWAM